MEDKKQGFYSREETVNASVEYFNGDQMAAEVWVNKYALKDMEGNIYELTPDDMHNRLSDEFARIEKKYNSPLSKDEIYNVIKGFKYIVPGGSPMAGIGNNHQVVSISNCFVIGNEKDADSYGGILNLDQELVQLQKRRAGVGIDLSFIRPEGSMVKNSALTSTGIVPFMERFSNSTREVAQDGRRGALMESIFITHPDSEKFIDAKTKEGKVTGANISVKITDSFMKAVKADGSFVQQYPVESENPKFFQEAAAKPLWDKIIHNAWRWAEPGIMFWDNIINESIPDCYADLGYKTVSTNPCVTLDSWIMTTNGPRQVVDLIGKEFCAYVDGVAYRSTERGFFKTGENKDVFEIETKGGLKTKSTDNHSFKQVTKEKRGKKDFLWTELKDLKEGDCLNVNCHKEIEWLGNGNSSLGWLIGNLLGDGTFENDTAILRYWGNTREQMKNHAVAQLKQELRCRADLGSGDVNKEIISVKSVHLGDEFIQCGISKNKKINEGAIEGHSSDFYKGFLSGWFDADGTVLNNVEKGISVRLASSIVENLEIAQRMLLRLGIFSKIYKNRRVEQFKEMPDGKGGLKKYKIKSQHELVISKNNVEEFKNRVGFVDNEKINKLKNSLLKLKRGLYQEKFIDKIKSINFVGIEDVYDCQIPGVHEFDVNGISVHNCGEIPLCPGDSCRLLAINLFSYVVNPFTKGAYFNFELFKKHVDIAMRIMDDLVELELEKIDSILAKIESDPEEEKVKRTERELWEMIREKATNGRRTGLGITAEGDMLAALGLTYGSNKGVEFSEEVHKILKLEAYRSSVEMAKKRGCFPIWDAEREKNNPFIKRIKEEDPELWEEMQKHGRRNIALLTIAPTGTSSMMTQTTSGIEPVFLPIYKRRRKINPQEKDVKVDFTDKQGDNWQEYVVFHHKFKLWLEVNGHDVEEVKAMSEIELDELIKKSPYYKATAHDVDWVSKVKMQGKIQKHIDHSISVTVNLPEDATEDVVASVYEAGWKSGCKGITVYREGSRDGVLISSSDSGKIPNKNSHAVKRPKIVNADVIRFQNDYEKWVAVIGKVQLVEDGEEEPYELFTGKLDSINIPNYVEKGQIIKRKTDKGSVYDFRYYDKEGFEVMVTGLSRFFKKEYWNYAKLISGLLRHRMPMEHVANVVKGLNLDDTTLNTWKNGVVRILNRYVEDGTKSSNTCEFCGATLVFSEGCLKCEACGKYSKCG